MLQRVRRHRPPHDLKLSALLDPLSGEVAPDSTHVELLAEVVLFVYSSVLPHLFVPVLEGYVEAAMLLVAGVAECEDKLDDIVVFVWDEPLVVKVGLGEVARSRCLPLIR